MDKEAWQYSCRAFQKAIGCMPVNSMGVFQRELPKKGRAAIRR